MEEAVEDVTEEAEDEPSSTLQKKRVKVYELRNNDWFDRGTGYCSATFMQPATEDGKPHRDPRVIVEAEDDPERMLLETRIAKEDGFQKQQETLIVWTDPTSGIDMALSFQEADGCTKIWEFINEAQQNCHLVNDDSLSEDLAMELPSTVSLPPAELGSLSEIEANIRGMSQTAGGRDALAKFIMGEDYINKLIPLVDTAEDFESLPDLHRLCTIMKTVILLNDPAIIEHAVSDDCINGVVGALEYDPDFPSHKANHRLWLNNEGHFKEVVPIEDDQIRRKIHQTYRLQYLKDVVLARILDDPTFSVLNSLIFFNQVEIVQHLQANSGFLSDLFAIFKVPNQDQKQRKEAVLFIQQCCAIAKNLQPPARQTLYNNFIAHGLLQVIHFGLRHVDVGVRVGATDILVSMIDHDPQMIRSTIYRQINDNQPPLTDSLIELLLWEVDLGVKSQISDALKVLLDGGPTVQFQETFAKVNGELPQGRRPMDHNPQQELFLARFYESSAVKLFRPLLDLEGRSSMSFTVQQASMFTCLIEILCFFIRQHYHRSKYFVMHKNVAQRVAQLLGCPEKYLRLVAIRFFRQLIGLQDEFYIKHLIEKQVFGPVLEVLVRTMPRDNLLSSACLEFFEFIRKENIKDVVKHLVHGYRDRLLSLGYIDTFRDIILRYDQSQGFTSNPDYFLEPEEDLSRRQTTHTRLIEPIVDATEDEYWNTSDDDEDALTKDAEKQAAANGVSTPSSKALVDYPSDEEVDENADPELLSTASTGVSGLERKATQAEAGDKVLTTSGTNVKAPTAHEAQPQASEPLQQAAPSLERLSEKRRREDDEDDELGKLMQNKRRNSSSAGSNASVTGGGTVRKKKSFSGGSGGTPKKIAISLSPAVKAGTGARSDEEP